MNIRKWFMLVLCLLIAVLLVWLLLLSKCPKSPEYLRKPAIQLREAEGEVRSVFSPLETVGLQAEHLQPAAHYSVQVLGPDDKEVSHALLTTDSSGRLPYAPLWFDIGVEYEKGSRIGRITEVNETGKHRIVISSERNKERYEVGFALADRQQPLVFAADRNGNPQRAFLVKEQDAYLVGKHFPANTSVRVYLTEHQYSWRDQSTLAHLAKNYQTIALGPNQTEFMKRVFPRASTLAGAYDVVVDVDQDGTYSRNAQKKDLHAVFFFQYPPQPLPAPPPAPTPSPAPIEQQMTCRTPSPLPPSAPSPHYKDTFAIGEDVWVSINPVVQGQNYAGRNARIYVVPQLTAAQWTDGMALSDSSNGYEEVVIQPGCANVNYHLIWPNPQTAGGYDVVADFEPFGVYNQGTDIVDMLDAAGLKIGSTEVDVSQVKFNWGAGSNAVNLQNHVTNSLVSVPEWDKSAGTKEPAAYVRNTTISIQARFHKNAAAVPNQVVIWASSSKGVALAQQTVSFVGDDSGFVTFTASAPLPNYIRKNDFIWQWYYAVPPYPGTIANPIDATEHTVCTTWQAPLELPAYKEPMLWTAEWAQYRSDDKSICDAIIHNLPQSGLKYGIGGWSVDAILDNGGGMCGGWYKMFAHMAACQGVFVHQRFYNLRNDAASAPEVKWTAINIKSGGLNQSQPTRPAVDWSDVDVVYPNPAPGDIIVRNEKRYNFFAPGDGHCINFLEFQGKTYLYDASFGTGPFPDTFTSVPSGDLMGNSLAAFRTYYHDIAIDYMFGTIKLSDNTTQDLTIKTTLIPNLRDPNDPNSYEIHYKWW